MVDGLPPDVLLRPVDTYAHVFLPPERLSVFRQTVARTGQVRDVGWIPVDPLVPLGSAATGSVQELEVPPGWLRTTATAA